MLERASVATLASTLNSTASKPAMTPEEIIHQLMCVIRRDFRCSERFMPRSEYRSIKGMTNFVGSHSSRRAYQWKIINEHKGTPVGAHSAVGGLREDAREVFEGIRRRKAGSSPEGCLDNAIDKAALISTGYGECQELTSYLCLELLRCGIPSEKMVLINQDEILPPSMGFGAHPLQAALHAYVRVRLPNGTMLVVDPFFDLVCPEKEYLSHPIIQKYVKSYFPIDRAVGRELQSYTPEMFPSATIKQIDALTASFVTESKRAIAKVEKKYAPFLPAKGAPIVTSSAPFFSLGKEIIVANLNTVVPAILASGTAPSWQYNPSRQFAFINLDDIEQLRRIRDHLKAHAEVGKVRDIKMGRGQNGKLCLELQVLDSTCLPKIPMLPPKLGATINPVYTRTSTCSAFFNRRTGMMAVGAVAGALTGGIGLAIAGAAAGLASEMIIDVARDAEKENRMSIQR